MHLWFYNRDMTFAYHEVRLSSLQEVLKNGLKCISRGDKGDDKDIIRTDALLDEHCPASLRRAGVSRDNNLYAYVAIDDKISDIKNGKYIGVHDFVKRSEQKVLKLTLDPHRCFVSDLDIYDKVMDAIKNHASDTDLQVLAHEYWSLLTPLHRFQPSSVARPEIMITYDIDPKDIKQL
jgi:hypothetical protein